MKLYIGNIWKTNIGSTGYCNMILFVGNMILV